MTRHTKIGFYGLAFVLFILVAVPLFGYVTMHLWNWLMPQLFRLPAVTFWQALGLIVLTRILFGGFKWRSRMRGNWINRREKLTPEEREAFARAMRDRCAPFQSGPQAPPSSPAANL
jgi:hypothetical protein